MPGHEEEQVRGFLSWEDVFGEGDKGSLRIRVWLWDD